MRSIILLLFIFITSCQTAETLPKPKGYLNLTYPVATYQKLPIKRPFSFNVSKQTIIKDLPKNWLKISYPKLKASIDITYRPLNNNLKELLMEAEKLVFEHTIKAEEISSNSYENTTKKVSAKLFTITGNAASQIQFHATDSTKHFLKASLFFYSKPNYDSILPAVAYLKKDMIKMIETLQWNR